MKLTRQQILDIEKKTYSRCFYCSGSYSQFHHLVFRSQGGSDNVDNLVCICYMCHYELHFGKNSKEYKQKSYEYLGNLDNCYKSNKVKHKRIK